MSDTKTNLLRGLARGIGPDVLGGPVDLAEMLLNAGLSGYGHMAERLGIRRADSLPKFSKSVGTSDWWAEKSGLEGEGVAYEAGRFLPMLGGMAAAKAPQIIGNATKPRASGMREKQRGALRVGGDPDLLLAHNMDITSDIPSELYSPSLGITDAKRGKQPVLTGFGGGFDSGLWLLPRIGAFSPKTTPSTIFNRDAYTSRWPDFLGRRVGDPSTGVRPDDDALKRLFDRGLIRSRVAQWKGPGTRFGEMHPGSGHTMAIGSSPRFRSFKHYEEHPLGAALLRAKGDPAEMTDNHWENAKGLLADFYDATGHHLDFIRRSPQYNRSLLGGLADPRLNKLDKDQLQRLFEVLESYPYQGQKQNLRNMALSQLGPLGSRLAPDQIASFQERARDILKGLASTPSEYGELKVTGPVAINPENWAAAVFRGRFMAPNQVDDFRKRLIQKWKIPVVFDESDDTGDLAELLLHLQSKAPPKKGEGPTSVNIPWPPTPPNTSLPQAPPKPKAFTELMNKANFAGTGSPVTNLTLPELQSLINSGVLDFGEFDVVEYVMKNKLFKK